MTADIEELLRRTAREDVDAVLRPESLAARVKRRRRRHTVARVGAGAAVLAVVSLVSVRLTDDPDDRLETSGTASESSVELQATGLDGWTVTLTLPETLASGFQVTELSAQLNTEQRGWRVDATRDSSAEVDPPDTCNQPQQAAIERILDDGWSIVISGDGFTSDACQTLLGELEAFELRDGVPLYTGDSSLGPIDSPDIAAATNAARLSMFHRPCSSGETSERTSSGLLVSHIDDPARGAALTTVCNDAEDIELWIESETEPSAAQLEELSLAP